MAPSLLRKKRHNQQVQQAQPICPSPNFGLRHSLSLPDLTTPLLDPASWEELPPISARTFTPGAKTSHDVPFSPDIPPTPQTPVSTLVRPRKTSVINPSSSPIQFHRPFTPWQIVNNDTTFSLSPMFGAATPGRADFRTSRTTWGREGDGRTAVNRLGMEGGWRKRTKGRAAAGRLNVVVVGPKGVGKSSFIQTFLDSEEILSTGNECRNASVGSTASRDSLSSPSKISVEAIRENPSRTVPLGPTTRMSSHTVSVSHETLERTVLRLIDTPGLAMGGDLVEEKERERGVDGLLRMIEDRYAEVMREESRVIRRATRGEDDLIHLILYMIDSRSVLRPQAEQSQVDWSAVGVFDNNATNMAPAMVPSPELSAAEMDIIRRLSARANVLPVLAHADSLTVSELDIVRETVRTALLPIPRGGFGIFNDDGEEDRSKTPTPENVGLSGSTGNTRDFRPPTPASSVCSNTSLVMPFAIFNAERTSSEVNMARSFLWGRADVSNEEHNDFVALKTAVLGSHLKTLRTTTREVLYERFRTEKLLEKQSPNGV